MRTRTSSLLRSWAIMVTTALQNPKRVGRLAAGAITCLAVISLATMAAAQTKEQLAAQAYKRGMDSLANEQLDPALAHFTDSYRTYGHSYTAAMLSCLHATKLNFNMARNYARWADLGSPTLPNTLRSLVNEVRGFVQLALDPDLNRGRLDIKAPSCPTEPSTLPFFPVIRYRDQISFRSFHGKYLAAINDFTLKANRPTPDSWERFTVLNAASMGNSTALRYGDLMYIRTHHNRYVVAINDFSVKADRTEPSLWEQWTLVDPSEPNSKRPVRARDRVAFKSHHKRYFTAEKEGAVRGNEKKIRQWEIWTIVR